MPRKASPAPITGPTGWSRRPIYAPVERGFEREVRERLEYWDKLRAERTGDAAAASAHFAAIDWSGAAGERHAGIAVAICDAASGAPRSSAPAIAGRAPRCWTGCWTTCPPDTLVGLDSRHLAALRRSRRVSFPAGARARPMRARCGRWSTGCAATTRISAATSFVDHPEAAPPFPPPRRARGRPVRRRAAARPLPGDRAAQAARWAAGLLATSTSSARRRSASRA